ncbi:MAG: hypothetical protein JXA42_24645, partial [Anaerolineales bacterium]|nr:hypothetical protein [Anaerolineales bacterium]
GKPVDLEEERTPAPPEPEDTPSPPPLIKSPPAGSIRSPRLRSPRKTLRTRSRKHTGTPKPQRIEVVVYADMVDAFVLSSRERQIARRTWDLIPLEGGIVRTCECEKGDECEANNIVIRPAEWMSIDDQIKQEIKELCQEYGLPSRKVNYNLTSMLDDQFVPMLQFKLFGLWRDKDALDKARAAFDRLPKSRLR